MSLDAPRQRLSALRLCRMPAVGEAERARPTCPGPHSAVRRGRHSPWQLCRCLLASQRRATLSPAWLRTDCSLLAPLLAPLLLR